MTWDTAKLIRGKAYVQEIELVLDACKYTQAPYITYNLIEIGGGGSYSSSHTGSVTLFTSYPDHETTWGAGTIYLKSNVSGETITATLSGASLNITARGLFGTTATTINSGDTFVIKHLGDVDGSCRGYPHDCSTSDSYSETSKLRPIFSTAPAAGGELKWSGLRQSSIHYDDGEVDVGETIGSRASLSFDISDYRHNDYFFVPYPDKRTDAGTLWGKLLARHPYLEGREVIYREGYRDPYSLDEPVWIERTLIIDSYKLSDEKLSVKCLDPLSLTEDKKAKMPLASPARLLANLGTGGAGTTFNFYDAPNYYFGAMSASILVRIDSEVIVCTVSGATQLTVVTRGYRSTNKEHEAGASIQDCIRFTNTHVVDAIVYALENFTSTPAAYLNTTAYDAVKALMATSILDDAIITKPTAVVDFINDLVKIGNLGIYFDTALQEIVMVYVPVRDIESILIDEQNHIKRGSLSKDDNTKNQYTRFSTMWGLTDITSDQEEKYAVRYTSINVDLESAQGIGQVNERKLQKLPLLTNSVDDSLLGAGYTSRITSENDSKPKIVTFTLDASQVGITQSGELKKGSIINLSTKYNQDKDGNNISELFQVRKIDGNGYEGYKIKAKRFQFAVSGGETIDFTISSGGINYDLSDVYTPAAGSYTIYIEPGVEFSSYDTSVAAFTTGSQASGVSFRIINAGKILGMGGKGGNAGLQGSLARTSGVTGGTALDITVDCEIMTAGGLIWAGGGGGGSQEAVFYDNPSGPDYFGAANGGSGGQGYSTSFGGFKTIGGVFPAWEFEDSGSQSGPGMSGFRGGEWGRSGDGDNAGSSGIAIKKNGKSVTILDGNNDLNIRGRVE